MTREEYIEELRELYELSKRGAVPYSPLELLDRIKEAEKEGPKKETP